MDRIEFQTVHPRPGQEEIKPVMYFQGKQKGLILTSTNQDFLRATFGDEITASYSKPITLQAVRKTIAGRGVDIVPVSCGIPSLSESLDNNICQPDSARQPRSTSSGVVVFIRINRGQPRALGGIKPPQCLALSRERVAAPFAMCAQTGY